MIVRASRCRVRWHKINGTNRDFSLIIVNLLRCARLARGTRGDTYEKRIRATRDERSVDKRSQSSIGERKKERICHAAFNLVSVCMCARVSMRMCAAWSHAAITWREYFEYSNVSRGCYLSLTRYPSSIND